MLKISSHPPARILTRILAAWIFMQVLTYDTRSDAQLFYPANNHYYLIALYGLTYFEGRTLAAAYDGYLVSLNDSDEETFLLSQLPPTYKWIGLSDEVVEGQYLWESGEPVSYTNWAAGQPSGAFATVDFARWDNDWDATVSSFTCPAVLETSRPINAIGAVSLLECERQGFDLFLTWPDEGHDSYRLVRDDVFLATIPSDATSFLDSPGPGFHQYFLIADDGGILTPPTYCGESALHPGYVLSLEATVCVTGSVTTVRALLESQGPPVQGYSFGVCHDSSAAVFMGGVEGTATTALGRADFFTLSEHADGWTAAAILSFFGLWTLGPSPDWELAVIEYEAVATAPASVPLTICSTLGSPPVEVVMVSGDVAFLPVTLPGIIEVVPPFFLRGDCNFSAAIDIADVLFLGDRLFSTAPDYFPCLAACEANGDGALNIADMVFVLNYLFVSGPLPPQPFPACAEDPNPASGFVCIEGGQCP
ncbi:MAG: lectin-like protein [Planctomycetota bacterium]